MGQGSEWPLPLGQPRSLPTAHLQPTAGQCLEDVSPRLRASIPGELSSHAAKISAQTSPAHRQSCLDLHERIVVGAGIGLWLRGPKPFHARISPAVWPHAARLSGALQALTAV